MQHVTKRDENDYIKTFLSINLSPYSLKSMDMLKIIEPKIIFVMTFWKYVGETVSRKYFIQQYRLAL